MDYKQKYEEALERAKKVHTTNVDENKKSTEYIFPELRESEDEKMRNFIRHELVCLRATDKQGSDRYNELTEVITWLKKQGEKETPCDKCRKEHPSHSCQDITELGRCAVEHEHESNEQVKLKFKVGDKINIINREEKDSTILIITKINMDKKCYICNQGTIINFDEEKEWYKIKHKTIEWSEEDEIGFGDAMWAIEQARTIAKDENDMGNLWHAGWWLNSIKQRMKGE